ncbi:MAG TPA: bifunctional hydroxymethylpyrimidine kinase/phosphomethylpyrimidine kinase [Allosphingosinicella sp.]
MTIPRVLIIAGSDSGGGAGIQADIKTVTMLGGHAMTAITAITAQNTLGVDAVMPVPTQMVMAQIEAVVRDIGVDVVKIGMIGSAETAEAVAERLEQLDVPIIFDPVMVATSGGVLADKPTIAAFERLLRICTLATPNADELAALAGMKVTSRSCRDEAIERVIDGTGCRALLAKGGDARWADSDDEVEDWVFYGDEEFRWTSARIDTPHTHGTGCTLASAIAVGLAEGMPLVPAISRARLFVRLALQEAPGLGGGHGPMGHQRVRLDVGAGPRLNQVSLPAADLEATRNFYRLLGLTLIVDSAANRYLRFEAPGGATLSLYEEGEGVYFQHDDLDAEVARLQGLGVIFEELPQDRPWGWRQAWLRDPNGNRICLFQAGENRRFPPWRISTGK